MFHNSALRKKKVNKVFKIFPPKYSEVTEYNNNSCCHKEFKEFNCTQWSASVTFCGSDPKGNNCDRI